MKKFWVAGGTFVLFVVLAVVFYQANLSAEPEGVDYDKLTQESERNRELLEIWKDHVKALTKERDQAFQELERLKASRVSGPAAQQFGAVETIAQASSGPSRELQMRLSALQTQFQQVKKELSDSKADKERALQDKEKAMSQAERLQKEIGSLKAGRPAANPATKPDNSGKPDKPDNSSALQKEIEVLKSENARLKSDLQESIAYSGNATDRNAEVFMRQARSLQYENDSLKAEIEKIKVVEKELASTRNYFTPMIKELQEKNDRLASENNAFAADARRVREEANQISQKTQTLVEKNQAMESHLQAFKAQQEEWSTQIEAYQSQLQMASADKEKLKTTEEELGRLQSQFQALQKTRADNDKALSAKNEELKRLSGQLAELDRASREIESRETDNLRTVERYQTALRANLADMKNLKSNFEAYLESLVASFEERQK